MKNLFKLFMVGILLIVASVVAVATDGNVVAGMAAAGITATGFSWVTGHSLLDDAWAGHLFCIPLVGLKRRCNEPSLGGSKRLYIVLAEDLTADPCTYETAKTTGEIATIPLAATKKFIEIEAWYDTTKWDTEMKAGAGFSQSIDFEYLGFNKDVVKLAALLYETPVNIIAEGNDGSRYYIGSKYVPVMLDMKATSPAKGNAQKKATFTAKNEGYTFPVMPIASAATFLVEPLV